MEICCLACGRLEAEWLIINKKENWIIFKCRNCKVYLKVLIPSTEGDVAVLDTYDCSSNTTILGRIDEKENETVYPFSLGRFS
jgi:transcription elongation factor Elf1